MTMMIKMTITMVICRCHISCCQFVAACSTSRYDVFRRRKKEEEGGRRRKKRMYDDDDDKDDHNVGSLLLSYFLPTVCCCFCYKSVGCVPHDAVPHDAVPHEPCCGSNRPTGRSAAKHPLQTRV